MLTVSISIELIVCEVIHFFILGYICFFRRKQLQSATDEKSSRSKLSSLESKERDTKGENVGRSGLVYLSTEVIESRMPVGIYTSVVFF